MTDMNYLIIGLGFTALIVLANVAAFVLLPVIVSKYAKKDNSKA